MVCGAFDIPPSSFYDYLHRKHLVNVQQLHQRSEINRLFTESRSSAGSRTLMSMLRELGHQVGRYRVRRVMRELGLTCKQPGSHAYKTASVERPDIPNRLNRDFTPTTPAVILPTSGQAAAGVIWLRSWTYTVAVLLAGRYQINLTQN